MLGNKSPADPHCFSLGSDQRVLEAGVIEVTAFAEMSLWIGEARGPERERFVGFTNEHGMPIGFGEKRDGAQGSVLLLTELAGGVAYRGARLDQALVLQARQGHAQRRS